MDTQTHSSESPEPSDPPDGVSQVSSVPDSRTSANALPVDAKSRRELLRSLLHTLPRDVVQAEVDEWLRVGSGASDASVDDASLDPGEVFRPPGMKFIRDPLPIPETERQSTRTSTPDLFAIAIIPSRRSGGLRRASRRSPGG
jgi:hypothetical protein